MDSVLKRLPRVLGSVGLHDTARPGPDAAASGYTTLPNQALMRPEGLTNSGAAESIPIDSH